MLQSKTDLSGNWKLYYAENRQVKKMRETVKTAADAARLIYASVDATVPGNFERDLERAGLIADPYFGTNTIDMQKLENLHLWYTRTFVYHGTPDENTYLRFEGIDTVAEIYVNGSLVKEVSNMFLTYEIPVPELNDGKNEIVVHIIPAVIASRKYDIPVSSNALTYNYESLYIRKAASMYGWDIMPRIVSGGIWKPVSLIQKKPDRIDDIFIYPNSANEDCANLNISWQLSVDKDFLHDFRIRVHGVCEDSEFFGECEVLHTSHRMSVSVSNPKLWFPRNAGKPYLYDVTAELLYCGEVIDTYKLRTGIRTAELVRTSTTDKDGNGDFCFVINGKRVFAMGTNWVPLDAFHANDINRIDPAIDMAVDIGCNIIRLWGGNVYEHPHFFDRCDEEGILVWHDFGMGCAAYPQDRRFLEMLEPEFEFIIKQNRNHPSVVLWAGDNECDCAFSWAGLRRDPNDNVITRKLLPEMIRIHDPSRPYLPSSPYIDKEAFDSGKPLSEEHLWGPRDYFKGEFYKNTVCHFASETGYHGCPSPKSLAKFLSEDHLWPIFDATSNVTEFGMPDKEWLVHAACMRAKWEDPYAYRIPLMTRQVQTLIGEVPDDLDDYALASQISQAEAKKYFIERFRITRGRRNGIIWWNLIDGWPQISDAVVDYYYTKKLAYHYIKRSQQPVMLAFDEPEHDGKAITLYGVNDTTRDVTVSYRVKNVTDGTVVAKANAHLVREQSNRLISIDIEKDEKKFYYIEWEVSDGETVTRGCNHYHTNIRDIDLASYKTALESVGMLTLEGF